MKKMTRELRRSWTIWLSALLLAAPDLLAFLPSVKDSLPPMLYDYTFKGVIVLYIMLRVKTQRSIAKQGEQEQ